MDSTPESLEDADAERTAALARYLRAQAAKVAADAIAERPVCEDDLKELQRLSHEFGRHTSKKSKRRRWHILAAFAVTLGIVTILLTVRVQSTDVELDVTLSGLEISLSQESELFAERIALESIHINGLSSATLPPQGSDSSYEQLVNQRLILEVDRDSGGLKESALSLESLVLATNDTVELVREANNWLLKIKNTTSGEAVRKFELAVYGPLRIGSDNADERRDYLDPRQITLHPANQGFHIRFRPVHSEPWVLFEQLGVDHLVFVQRDDLSVGGDEEVSWRSTVLEGSLYLEALQGRKLALRRGENLVFSDPSGVIRVLEVQNADLQAQFHGTVEGLAVGATQRDLMPTLLEWLLARQGAALLWGSSAYLFGLLLAVMRWWREE